jgi:MerR family copper efflux transcriptional regulator
MDGYSISQVAERTGFPPSTLRFYEQTGLVCPARTAAGYRSYDDSDLEVLSFIGRAKGFGLSLDEITEVLSLLDSDRCAPVQGRLRDLVDAKIVDAQGRIAELLAFTGELQRVASTLALNTPDGPCDDTCGCTTEPDVRTSVRVALAAKPSGAHEEPIVCTLAPEGVTDRLADWQAVLAGATMREPIDRGVRARFAGDVDVAGIAALAAAEQDCCRFFTFRLTIDTDGVALEITGPPNAQPVIAALVGTAA